MYLTLGNVNVNLNMMRSVLAVTVRIHARSRVAASINDVNTMCVTGGLSHHTVLEESSYTHSI